MSNELTGSTFTAAEPRRQHHRHCRSLYCYYYKCTKTSLLNNVTLTAVIFIWKAYRFAETHVSRQRFHGWLMCLLWGLVVDNCGQDSMLWVEYRLRCCDPIQHVSGRAQRSLRGQRCCYICLYKIQGGPEKNGKKLTAP